MENVRKPEPEQRVELRRRRTGESREFLLRPARPGDEEGMLACVRGEYADSYFKRGFYSAEAIAAMDREGRYRFFVAETEGTIAAMVALTLFPEEDYIEPASQILLLEYRGYGLSTAMTRYLFPLAVRRKPSCLFVHAVTFHDITQKNCESAGFVPVGFRLGTFLTSGMENSYHRGRSEKYSEGILILPVEKRDAGTVYLPEELRSFGRDAYHRLGVPADIRTAEGSPADIRRLEDVPAAFQTAEGSPAAFQSAEGGAWNALAERCILRTVTDRLQRTVWIGVERSGRDLPRRIRTILEGFGNERLWTVQVTLHTDSPLLGWEYQELKDLGFFFTGLKPLCGTREGLYMQWIGDTRLHMEEYVLTEAFQRLRDEILVFYHRRTQPEGGKDLETET